MDISEAIIIEVEKNNVLFDKSQRDYKNIDKKRDIWKAIGKKVGLTGM